MSIFDRFKLSQDKKSEQKSTIESKVVIEEKTFKDGHLYIKRETKTGVEAQKEIQKHAESFSNLMKDFFKDFWSIP